MQTSGENQTLPSGRSMTDLPFRAFPVITWSNYAFAKEAGFVVWADGVPLMRVMAIDWSGAVSGSEGKIWLAEASDGSLLRLECGRSREQVADTLIEEAQRDPNFVVGIDFAFSLPAWYLVELGLTDAHQLWDLADREVEHWLASCQPPFWGRPGTRKPSSIEHFRRTEREVPSPGGISPKSVFQIGGAGAVGTGSLRGMRLLHRLAGERFSIWPFDRPGSPCVVEIYPRLLTGPVKKSNEAARTEYLRAHFPLIESEDAIRAASSEDAFDAAVSALVMAAHRDRLSSLQPVTDATYKLEGIIWHPAA
jgi:hypothetical protein